MLTDKSGILKKSLERLDCLYRQKQTPGVLPKSQKTVLEIELPRALDFYVYHNLCGGDLTGVPEPPLQRIH